MSEYLTGRQVRERFGNRPAIWLYRRQKEPDFPKPIYIGNMKFFSRADIIAWEEKKRHQGPMAEREPAKEGRIAKATATTTPNGSEATS